MTRKEFAGLVRKIIEELPQEFRDKFENIDFVIEQKPNLDTVKNLGMGAKGRLLLGLYQGVPLDDRTHYYGLVMPDKITLYKQNIERVCKLQGLDIGEEVKHVIQHEIAHYFGISDKRLTDLGIY